MTEKTKIVHIEYRFLGNFNVFADTQEEAEKIVERDCGMTLSLGIHTSNPDLVHDWEFPSHPESMIIPEHPEMPATVPMEAVVVTFRCEERIIVKQGSSDKEIANSAGPWAIDSIRKDFGNSMITCSTDFIRPFGSLSGEVDGTPAITMTDIHDTFVSGNFEEMCKMIKQYGAIKFFNDLHPHLTEEYAGDDICDVFTTIAKEYMRWLERER